MAQFTAAQALLRLAKQSRTVSSGDFSSRLSIFALLYAFVALNAITPEAQQFISQHIQSVEQLEIFLTLGSDAARTWSAHEVFCKIQSNENSVSDCLRYFLREGVVILEKEGRYQISDKSPNVVPIASELQKAYRERQVTIIEMIYKKPPRQIQNFADAFKLRKDK